jgi:V8-like Glu-specific endopeptidase
MSRSLVVSLALLLLLSFSALADEGMWTLDNFPSRTVQDKYGARITEDWLQQVQLSTARLDGGCTGSFVSPDGLVLTNNHCTWGCIRNLSSAEHNLSEEGFLADNREDEQVCPGMRISVLKEMEEITDKVERATAGKSETEANDARKAVLSRLEKSCEDDSKSGLSCESVTLYHGGQYFLYKYKRFEDVRLAFAPELPIAAFGGDPDNFNFPRWCLDMSLLRVYEDGKPAAMSHYLPWRRSGPEPGEVVFISGHPGSTQRLLTVAELEFRRSSTLPQRLLISSELRGRLMEWGKTGDEPARIVQQRILLIENGIKVRRNQMFSLMDDTQMARKRAAESELRRAVETDEVMRREYGSAWDDIERALAAYRTFADQYRFVEGGIGYRGQLLGMAQTLLRVADERLKPNEKRLREFRETALPRVEQRTLADVPIDDGYEKLTLAFFLDKMREWLGPDDPVVQQILGRESPDMVAERLVSGTRLADVEVRTQLWEGGADAVAASDDAMIVFVRDIDAKARALRKRYKDEVEAVIDAASEKLARARFAISGTDVYPDATFTLRVTYGSVTGWEDKGAEVPPFTRVHRLYERATGEDPFRLPESWVDGRKKLGGRTPFNLVATTDIVGGNSGSPVIDQQGRLVGLAFDGNIHSIAGSYWFDISKNRTVAVHPAVMLGAMENIYGARNLVKELEIVP